MFHQRRKHTIYFAKTFKRPKKSYRVFQFPSAIILKECKKVKASKKNFTKERKNDMKRHCKDVKKIMRMKWRSLNFSKSVTRRIGRFYSLKHYLNQMNLKNYQNPLMIQVRKNRSLKKHQAMEKRPLQRQAKSEKDPTI